MFFSRFGSLIAKYWLFIILAWVMLVVSVRSAAPRWDDITQDGDLAYLPKTSSSVIGEELLTRAFPQDRSKSQAVIIVARENGQLINEDIFAANDLARRFRNIEGVVSFQRALQKAEQAREARQDGLSNRAQQFQDQSDHLVEMARVALEEAVRLDEELREYSLPHQEGDDDAVATPTRLPEAYHNLAQVYRHLGQFEEANDLREVAVRLDRSLAGRQTDLLPRSAASWPLIDVWTWHDELIGRKLISDDRQARLIILHLSQEFLSTDNIRVLELVEEKLELVKRQLDPQRSVGLTIGVSGSAAVGGDMLRAARDSIRHTELFTVVLVVLVLMIVYRSPLLVAVPLITIGVSLTVAIGMTSLLTQLHLVPGFHWWDLKVFSTTRIFIVVILFGSGTDFCLFLIARYREELERGAGATEAVAASLAGVGEALAASALTTISGLSMMFFADFRKFSYSGPVIGLCLAVTLIASLTLAPALLRGCGRTLFWPLHRFAKREHNRATRIESFWQSFARPIVARPGLILAVSAVVLLPWAGYGYARANDVTYDVVSLLSMSSPSRMGTELLRQHFDVGESGPVTLLIQHDHQEADDELVRNEIAALTHELYLPSREELVELGRRAPDLDELIDQVVATDRTEVRLRQLEYLAAQNVKVEKLLGVASVRSISDPLGNYPPGAKIGLFNWKSRSTWSMRSHRIVQQAFVADSSALSSPVARFELLLRYDPFSKDAMGQLERIEQRVRSVVNDPQSFWYGSTFAFTGTTAAMSDLRDVTQSDNRRIQMLVVIAVSVVLLLILRRPVICLYMVASVLLSYFVTIGIAHLFFATIYGSDYQGLDWKVPVFLFVILVAVGQDYNVYLVTRVFEEQKEYGLFTGLRKAISSTGGIITSCGVIMAGTFISMTSGTWHHVLPFMGRLTPTDAGTLRSIVELGFALALGVLIDTFFVRTILLPAFLALMCRWTGTRPVAADGQL